MSNHPKPTKDEFTTAMHETMSIDEESDTKHKVCSFLSSLSWYKSVSLAEQMKSLGITEADVEKYRPEWEALQK
ncbi:MAG TPA: hypothetical protein PK079_07395 [Leptospiraceae bacterium]|nr:hypothetical protein [Leptospiraceae bacterium]HMW05790.1 hypothetical protein [Leptospiraceae bacterium]HMX32621.1 hypothetical protein [Leptospiraceae bacterium]HMY33335.1 hypothetical protein [Leptospiraceae bacterium]HMZ66209.1 hypothetical protein [Leptospiraceae bacterium]